MAEGEIRKVFRRCFVSGPDGPITTAIAAMLTERGIDTFTAASIAIGSSFSDEVLRMIAEADFVAVVLPERNAASAIYELGVARGLNKPTLVFSIGQFLPIDLQGTIIRHLPDPTRLSEVAVDIDRFLRNAKPPRLVADDTPRAAGQDLGWARQKLRLQRLPNAAERGQQFENLVGQIFEESGAEVRTTRQVHGDRGVDFVVWLNDVAYALGGPILVECKVLRGGSGSVIKNAESYVKQLNQTLSKSDASLGLFIFDHDRPNTPPTLFPTPKVLPFSIDDLIDGLEHGTFEQQVILRRRQASITRGSSS